MVFLIVVPGRVVTVDIDQDIVESAGEHLAAAGFDRVQVVCADGGYGYVEAAPYDRIILTVGTADITPAWWEQMKPGGRIVLPLEIGGSQKSSGLSKDRQLLSYGKRACGGETMDSTGY